MKEIINGNLENLDLPLLQYYNNVFDENFNLFN